MNKRIRNSGELHHINKAVLNTASEPTIKEPDDLNQTVDSSSEPDQSVKPTNRLQEPDLSQKFKRHLKEHWIEWVIGIIAFSCITFFNHINNARIEFNNLNNDITNNQKSIEDLKGDLKESQNEINNLDDKVDAHDVEINVNKALINARNDTTN